MKFLLFLFLLVGCGYEQPDTRHTVSARSFIEPELEEYVLVFEHLVLGHELTKTVSIKFSELDESYLGLCNSYEDGTKRIVLDTDVMRESKTMIQEVVFHELGHCELGLNHDFDLMLTEEMTFHSNLFGFTIKDQWRFPKSIMYPYVFDPSLYLPNHRDYYLENLKNGSSFDKAKEIISISSKEQLDQTGKNFYTLYQDEKVVLSTERYSEVVEFVNINGEFSLVKSYPSLSRPID